MPKIVNYVIIKETERNNGGVLSVIDRWPPISTNLPEVRITNFLFSPHPLAIWMEITTSLACG